jgi:3-oxoacyl-[acyl-carrier protein] reductase
MSKLLAGKNALVTGATRGIGRGISQMFAENGASVMLVGRTSRDGANAADDVRAHGGRAAFHAADVSNWSDVTNSVAATVEAFGSVDILCCNVGIYPSASIADMSVEDWDHVMAVNLKSTFLYVKACLPQFVMKPGGRVLIVSSITGPITGHPGWSHYGASKAGQLGFLRSAALELAQYKTTVNAILPGNIAADGASAAEIAYGSAMAKHIPLGRLGLAKEVGSAAVFLATEQAAFITGQALVIDGGQTLFEYQGDESIGAGDQSSSVRRRDFQV